MRKATHFPNLINAYDLGHNGEWPTRVVRRLPTGKDVYMPARPVGYQSILSAMKLAWGVFRGRYDALVWPGQGDDR